MMAIQKQDSDRRRDVLLLVPAILCIAASVVTAQDTDRQTSRSIQAGGLTFQFATSAHGGRLLAQQDTFVRNLSAFDRQVRMHEKADPGEQAFLQFAAKQVIEWPDDTEQLIRRALEQLDEPLAQYELPAAGPILLIHTNGREESGAAYTRGSAIILPRGMTGTSDHPPTRLIAHELFHILSRNQPDWRDQLYSIIGFRKIGKVALPESLSRRRITNPDAPEIQHAIQVRVSDQREAMLMPSLLAKKPFSLDQRSIFRYLEFKLMEVHQNEQGEWRPTTVEGAVVFHDPSLPDFHRQIGRNTAYIIHPEEILADNFAMLLTGAEPKDPWLLDSIKRVLLPDRGRED